MGFVLLVRPERLGQRIDTRGVFVGRERARPLLTTLLYNYSSVTMGATHRITLLYLLLFPALVSDSMLSGDS